MKKVLVVDDDKDIADTVKFILMRAGYDVKILLDSVNLQEIVIDYQPNLILLDVRLPGKSGIEWCGELRKIYSIPIILFSAEPKIAYKECGADNFIAKPFRVAHLVKMINSYLLESNEILS